MPGVSRRLAETFARARADGRVAVLPFMTVGYPDLETSVALVKAMVAAGADGIELGVPFSDPLADGPTVQMASQAALANGITPPDAHDVVRRLRAEGVAVPLILMGYLNTVLAMGEERYIAGAAAAGADALIIVDLPPEESDAIRARCAENGLDLILFATPTSDDARLAELLSRASGFLYCVGVVGVTGARDTLSPELPDFLRRLRARTDVPLVVGFGISKPEHVKALGGLADGAIVASVLIDMVESAPREERVERVRTYVEVLTGRSETSTT
jgi:tryptophan synthase alpha chain